MNYLINSNHTFLSVDIAAAGAFFHVSIVNIIATTCCQVCVCHYSGRRRLTPTQYRPKTLTIYTFLVVYIEICRFPMSFPKNPRRYISQKHMFLFTGEFEVIQPFQIFHSARSPLTLFLICPHLSFHCVSF